MALARLRRGLLAPWLGLLALALPAQDELGLGKMWTFERPPLAYLQREYGFRADAAWWDRLRLASLRFGSGCSASFVSPRGLILTNHHCARDAIAKVQGDRDWVRDGFVAKELGDEVRVPGLAVQQLVGMTDVTAAMLEGTAGMAPAAAEQRLQENRERLVAAAQAARPERRAEVVKLFQGAAWQLYEYRVFDDVRLVMAPHLQVAHFGGDPDNFVYPRYAIDFAFCRAYQDGQPADTAACHLPWGDGPQAGDLVFLTGNPGSTQRLLTASQVDYQREARYPRLRQQIDARIAILRGFMAADAETKKRLLPSLLRLENAQKLYRGEAAALRDPAFQQRKAAAEAAFRARVEQAGRRADLGLWDELAALMQQKRALEGPANFHSAGGSPHLLRALALLAYAATGDPARQQEALDVVVDDDPLPRAFFTDHLTRARSWLPAGDPYLAAALGGREPAEAVAALVATSRIGDPAFVDQLLAGGRAAIEASTDPALVLARVLRPLQLAAQKAAAEVAAAEGQLGARLARLLFAVYGDDVSPDATSTLRWSDGRVAGYAYNGTLAPWRTVFHGLFARHAEFDGEHPFDLPSAWLLAKDRLDLRAPVDFVCTVDSTGGNSGSPLVDRQGRLCGLLFDGNIESLANEFLYGERVERSVCVHPQAITEALGKVYAAHRVLREIGR